MVNLKILPGKILPGSYRRRNSTLEGNWSAYTIRTRVISIFFYTLPSNTLKRVLSVIIKFKLFANICRYTSLPPSSINMLSLLIESKVRLPESSPVHSKSTKRDLLRTQGEREFFLGIVRDIATDLDLKSLSHKIVDNLSVSKLYVKLAEHVAYIVFPYYIYCNNFNIVSIEILITFS